MYTDSQKRENFNSMNFQLFQLSVINPIIESNPLQLNAFFNLIYLLVKSISHYYGCYNLHNIAIGALNTNIRTKM